MRAPFCYSFLSQPPWRLSERVAGWALAAVRVSLPQLWQCPPCSQQQGRRDPADMENLLVCDPYSPLLLVTFHTVSAYKIQRNLKPKGRMARSAFDPASIPGPTCLPQNPYTQAMRRMTGGYCRATPSRIADNSSVISFWEKDWTPT